MGLAYIENLNGDVISYMDDPLNKTNYRNTNNTYNEDFNCGGWALNTFNWLCLSLLMLQCVVLPTWKMKLMTAMTNATMMKFLQ